MQRDPNYLCLGTGVEIDGNSPWKSLLVWSQSVLVVWLLMSSSHLEFYFRIVHS